MPYEGVKNTKNTVFVPENCFLFTPSVFGYKIEKVQEIFNFLEIGFIV